MRLYTSSASFTRPANATVYASGQLVANSTVAGSVVPMTFLLSTNGFLLTAVKLKLTGSAVNTNAQFTLHLYQFQPTSSAGDGSSFSTSNESGYLGNVYIDCTQFPVATFDVVGIANCNPNVIPIFPDTSPGASGPLNQIYGLLRAEAAYPPSSAEVITVTLMGVD